VTTNDRRVAEAKERGRALKRPSWSPPARVTFVSKALRPSLLRRYAGVAAWTLMIGIGLWMAAMALVTLP